MNTRAILLVVLVLLTAGVYVYNFSGLFDSNQLHGTYKLMPPQPPWHDIRGVGFSLDRDYELTSVMVVPLPTEPDTAGEQSPAEDAEPLWHLVGDSTSQPLRAFIYGRPLKGMRAADDTPRARKLDPGTPYRLIVEARSRSGAIDFETEPNR